MQMQHSTFNGSFYPRNWRIIAPLVCQGWTNQHIQLQPSIRVQDSPSPARHSLSPVKRSGTSEIPQKVEAGGTGGRKHNVSRFRPISGWKKSSPGKGHEETSCFMAAKKPISQGEKGWTFVRSNQNSTSSQISSNTPVGMEVPKQQENAGEKSHKKMAKLNLTSW